MKNLTILISGKQGSGKTTLAESLCNSINVMMNERNIRAQHLSFAEPLYKMHNAVLSEMSSMGFDVPAKDGDLLQALGDYARKKYGDDVFVKAVKAKIARTMEYASKLEGFIAVISDCRFKSEWSAFPDAFTVRLNCPVEIRRKRIEETPGQSWRENQDHASETELDLTEFDLTYQTDTVATPVIIGNLLPLIMRRFE